MIGGTGGFEIREFNPESAWGTETMWRWMAGALAALCAAGTAEGSEAPLKASACPKGVPQEITCFRGRDANGAFVLAARPVEWNGILLVHTYGGPRLTPPSASTTDEDLLRFVEMVQDGHVWVATSRRREGFGVTKGAEDAEASRRMAIALFGQPRLTFVHGQSWGANVGAKLIETLNEPGAGGKRPYDAALLTSGVLAGGTRAYDMRVDLRAAFQAVCGTHPKPEEAQYPLGLGLPAGAKMTRQDLEGRFNDCTGRDKPVAERSQAQVTAARDLAAASRIPEPQLLSSLSWATFVFQDLSQNLTGGRNPFGNMGVKYQGTSDDTAFNRKVPRFAADPEAAKALAADSDLTGRVAVPVLTLHGIRDATAFVEHEAAYRATLAQAGTADRLVQVFVDEQEHSKMSPPYYPAALQVLAAWVENAKRPTPDELRLACEQKSRRFSGVCAVKPEYQPQAWAQRVNPR